MKTLKTKLSLLVGCSLQLVMTSDLSANYDLEDFNRSSHVAHYNKLPSVEESDTKLQNASQFKEFLEKADEVVTRYELNGLMGLRLIHRHFALGENQVMAEKYEVVESVPSLVTQARSLNEAEEMKALPSSWIFSTAPDKEVLLFETSSDPAVVQTRSLLERSPEFFDEMGKTISAYNLNHLLSLAVLKRDTLIAQENQNYAEINSADQQRSIVQLWNAEDTLSNSIRTSWSFRGPKKVDCQGHQQCIGHHNCTFHL